MIDDELAAHVLQLYQVENLSIRQIADYHGMCRRTVSRLIRIDGELPIRTASETLLSPYRRLVEEWYAQYPKLKASQIYLRLKGLGFTGSQSTVERATKKLRTRKPIMFHERVLLPAEEAQVDWMVLSLPWGTVYGFVYILAWSRYLVVRFYPKMTFEFFLDGHLEAFRECFGIAHAHRYDNLKSVVISRKPALLYASMPSLLTLHGIIVLLFIPVRHTDPMRKGEWNGLSVT